MSSGPHARATRILIDATMARRGGGFTYLVNLLPRLAEQAPERRFRVLVRSPALADALPQRDNVEISKLGDAGFAKRLAFTWFGTPRIARAWRADLHFAAGDLAPLRAPCPVIASFRNPNVFTSLDQGWYAYQVFRLGALRRLAQLTSRTSARILFVSHDSARWIGDAIGLAPEKRAVVHHGIDLERFSTRSSATHHPRPYVLSVSSIYRYKNFVRLIEAWTELARREPEAPDLVIVGDDMDPDYSAKMRAARERAGALADRVRLIGHVPYAEVSGWYQGASLFAFPSYLETFGHPLLEAMACDVPVLAADLDVSREVAADAALYVDAHDAAAWTEGMQRLLHDDALRERQIARGRERVSRFTWDASATAHLTLFDTLVADQTA